MFGDLTRQSLLDGLRDFDDQAWRRFHSLYSPLIQQWLVRRGVQPADADDLLQEVMQIALRELPDFAHNGRPGAFRRWLRGTVSNRLRGFWRKNKRQAAAGGDQYADMAEQLSDPSSELSRAWDEEYERVVRDRLLGAVEDEFEPRTLDAFRLVALEGKKPSEIADDVGLSENAVRIAKSRVLKRLRELGRGMID